MSKDQLWDDRDDEVPDDDEIVEVEAREVKDDDEQDSLPSAGMDNTLVRPADNIDEVVEVYDQFEELKEKLLTSEDLTEISGNAHVNKSGWRKIATAFNLTIETIKSERIVEDGVVKFTVEARATAPNGKTVTGEAMCASNESNHMESADNVSDWSKDDEDMLKIDGKWRRLKDPVEVNDHNILATAETRAKNRAISDLVGGGEVSAEEIGSKKKQDILE